VPWTINKARKIQSPIPRGLRSYLDTATAIKPGEVRDRIGKRKELCEMVHPETKTTKAGGPGCAKTRRQNGDDIAERFTKDTAKKEQHAGAHRPTRRHPRQEGIPVPPMSSDLTRQGRRDRRTGGKG
jgi:hypothetical protein